MTGTAIALRNLRIGIATGGTGQVRPVVHGISLAVERGEFFGIAGESGSGKTLTTRAIAGLLPPAAVPEGGIEILGTDYSTATEIDWRNAHRHTLGVVFQNPMTSLNPRMTIYAQLREALPPRDNRRRQHDARRIAELLDQVKVPQAAERLRQFPHELSGGIAQRVAIAMALARQPAILIADEPTTALDATTQVQVLDLLDELRVINDLTVVLVSHDLDVIRDRCDHVAVMRSGEIVEQGTTAAIVSAPSADYTRELLAAAPTSLLTSEHARPHAAKAGDEAAGDPPILEFRNVRKSYHSARRAADGRSRAAVDDLSLAVGPGEVVGIVGESGSGKTTTARMGVGLTPPDSGDILFDGRPLRQAPREVSRAWRNDVQYVFQDNYAALNPRYTVGQCVLEPVLNGKRPRSAADRSRAEQILTTVGLEPAYIDRHPHQLSGGERQRVGIARALVREPRLIIADEPVSALDVTVQKRILDLILRLNRNRGMAFLIISHDLGVVSYLCDRVAVMQDGRIVEQGDVPTVLHAPSTDFTRQLTEGLRRRVPGRSPDGTPLAPEMAAAETWHDAGLPTPTAEGS